MKNIQSSCFKFVWCCYKTSLVLTVVPMAQFPLLCAHWQLSFMPYNWATAFVLSSLAVPLRCISPAVGWKWLGRFLDLQERCAASHSYHAIQQHLLGWPVLVVSNLLPILINVCHLLTLGGESESSREPHVFTLCLSHQGDGKIEAGKFGGGGGPDHLSACSPGQNSSHRPWTDTEEEMNWWGVAGESCPASCSNVPGAVCSTLLSLGWKHWDLKESFTRRAELLLQFGGAGVFAREWGNGAHWRQGQC